MIRSVLLTSSAILFLGSCGSGMEETVTKSVLISAGPEFAVNLQTALITAEPGSTLVLPAGTFALTDGLSSRSRARERTRPFSIFQVKQERAKGCW